MRPARFTSLAFLGSLIVLVLACAATTSGAQAIHDGSRSAGDAALVMAGNPPMDDGFSAVEAEALTRRALSRSSAAARRTVASPAPLLPTAATTRVARSPLVDPGPTLERPLARRAVDVFTIRGPPLG